MIPIQQLIEQLLKAQTTLQQAPTPAQVMLYEDEAKLIGLI